MTSWICSCREHGSGWEVANVTVGFSIILIGEGVSGIYYDGEQYISGIEINLRELYHNISHWREYSRE